MTNLAEADVADRSPQDNESSRDLADLALAGCRIVRQPLMQVTFEVHHVVDRPGYLAGHVTAAESPVASEAKCAVENTVRQGPVTEAESKSKVGTEVKAATKAESRAAAEDRIGFGETLTTSAYGLGLVIVTRTAVGVGSRRSYPRGRQTKCEVDNTDERRLFRGTARPNPSFLYETAWRYEGLICVDDQDQTMRVWHSRAVLKVLNKITQLADNFHLPILSLQAPAQIQPNDSEISEHLPWREERLLPPAASIAVRFAIALQHPSPDKVLKISEKLARFCADRGFGFWLADTSPGSRQGNWFSITECDSSRTAARRSRQTIGRRAVKLAIPITLVGPARGETTGALVSFLSQYKAVGITGCSVAPLDDLLFVHLQLAFAGVPDAAVKSLDNHIRPLGDPGGPPTGELIRMLQILDLHRQVEPGDMNQLDVRDYQCLMGPSRRLTHPNMRERMAVWFSWQTQGASIGLSMPLVELHGALNDACIADMPNIEYLICRDMGNAVFRGRGKLSIPCSVLENYSSDTLESPPANLCISIEEAWRSRVARGGRGGVRELTVAWRECWLGHWSLPL